MFKFDADTYYTLQDIEAILSPDGLSARYLLDTVQPTKTFRNAWHGARINEALDRYERRREAERERLEHPNRRGRPRKIEAEIEQLAMPKV